MRTISTQMVGRTLLHEPKTNPLVAARWQGRTVVGGYHNAWSTLINNQHRNVRSKQLGSTNNQSHALPVGLTRSGQARVCSIPNFKRCGVCERFQQRRRWWRWWLQRRWLDERCCTNPKRIPGSNSGAAKTSQGGTGFVNSDCSHHCKTLLPICKYM